jgi:hypothetical protein
MNFRRLNGNLSLRLYEPPSFKVESIASFQPDRPITCKPTETLFTAAVHQKVGSGTGGALRGLLQFWTD